MPGAVGPRQIFLRTHLDQARSRPPEFLRLIAFVGAIERVRLGRGGGDQFHVHVVKRIDQNDEALGRVAIVERMTGMWSRMIV